MLTGTPTQTPRFGSVIHLYGPNRVISSLALGVTHDINQNGRGLAVSDDHARKLFKQPDELPVRVTLYTDEDALTYVKGQDGFVFNQAFFQPWEEKFESGQHRKETPLIVSQAIESAFLHREIREKIDDLLDTTVTATDKQDKPGIFTHDTEDRRWTSFRQQVIGSLLPVAEKVQAFVSELTRSQQIEFDSLSDFRWKLRDNMDFQALRAEFNAAAKAQILGKNRKPELEAFLQKLREKPGSTGIIAGAEADVDALTPEMIASVDGNVLHVPGFDGIVKITNEGFPHQETPFRNQAQWALKNIHSGSIPFLFSNPLYAKTRLDAEVYSYGGYTLNVGDVEVKLPE